MGALHLCKIGCEEQVQRPHAVLVCCLRRCVAVNDSCGLRVCFYLTSHRFGVCVALLF